MNRNLKFRAWDKQDREMINDIWIAPEYDWQVFSDNDAMCERERKPVGTFIIMQYTGLKDKNGVEIYEGDITSSGWQIMFDDGIFCPFYDFGRQERYEDVGTNWWRNCEIIGNIYQNPELLIN